MKKKLQATRAKQAADLNRRLIDIWYSLEKIPSVSGKAAFMDKVLLAKRISHSLAWNLTVEAGENPACISLAEAMHTRRVVRKPLSNL
jgi:hypothetical protein